MFIKLLQKFKLTRWVVYQIIKSHGRDGANKIASLLIKSNKILDIGMGSGHVCHELQKRGYNVHPVDVVNLSFVPGLIPEIYDGQRLPYADKTFNVALLLLVLHHTKNPESIIADAQRVAKRVIISEDIYTNTYDKYLTFFLDSLLNLEFFGHPHTNKSDKAWLDYFKKQGLQIEHAAYSKSLGGSLKNATYVLKT